MRSTFLMGVDDGSEDPFSSEAGGFESEGNVQTSPTGKSSLRQTTMRQTTKGSLANRSFASEKRSYVSEASLSQSSPSLKRSATSGGFGEKKDTLFFGTQVGTLRIQDMILDRAYTFLDYVRGGLELRMMLGIDFTRSNMDKQNPDSLHSLVDMDLPTSYETAIIALGSVLRSYDTTDEYAVYGFGARIPPSHSVCSNCFALTGDFLHPQVHGIDGILRAYRRSLQVVHMHGPSCPGDVLELGSYYARNYMQEPEKEGGVLRSNVPPDMNYFVLIVLTDGDIVNEKRIVQELKKMQEYPISVFFIGIGTSKDFDFWRELPNATALDFDRDFEKTKKDTVMSKKAVRRVARFVKFS
ncbi:CPNE1, partial [Symbiodinium sp. CCMP2456]